METPARDSLPFSQGVEKETDREREEREREGREREGREREGRERWRETTVLQTSILRIHASNDLAGMKSGYFNILVISRWEVVRLLLVTGVVYQLWICNAV